MNEDSKKKKNFWKEGWGSFFIAILIALTIRWLLIEAYVIPSGSMLPTLLIHDHIFVNKITYGVRFPFTKSWIAKFRKPDRGEVIVFRYPEDESIFFIKRVVAVAGDKVAFREGKLFINEQEVEQKVPPPGNEFERLNEDSFLGSRSKNESKDDYIHWLETSGEYTHSVLLKRGGNLFANFGPTIVPDGHVFVLGDNRNNSQDSRYWGFLPNENLIGKAMFVWLSCEDTLPVVTFLCNPLEIRWGRFFHSIH